MARVSIEDCQRQMPNRFALVVVAANRARQLMASSQALIDTKNKEAVTALREIAEGKVTFKGAIKTLDQQETSSAPEDVSTEEAQAASESVKEVGETEVPKEAASEAASSDAGETSEPS